MHRLIDTKQEQTLYYKQRLFLQGSGVRGAPEAREGVGGGGAGAAAEYTGFWKRNSSGFCDTYEGLQAAHHSAGMMLQEGSLPQQHTAGDNLAGHLNVLCTPSNNGFML